MIVTCVTVYKRNSGVLPRGQTHVNYALNKNYYFFFLFVNTQLLT